MTIQTYEPHTDRIVGQVDSWTLVLAEVGDLAGKIAGTEFVPESMRGKPAAVAAAILTGRELGVGPMTALQNIHIIKGKPGMSATLMRQLILAAGHQLRYVESTDSRCVMEGRRRGEEEWTQVAFTADQAKRAKIDLGTYPADKLVARATSRLARRIFADCLGGMPYLPEEAAEGGEDASPAVVSVEDARPARTAKRAQPPKSKGVARGQVRAVDDPEPVAADEPPLDDVVDGEVVDTDTGEVRDGSQPATTKQLQAIATALSFLDVTDREDRLQVTAALAGRADVESSKDLTVADASSVLDTLRRVGDLPEPEAALAALVGLGQVSRADVLGRLDELEAS